MTIELKSHAKVGVYVDAANISRNGGQRMQYDVLREFACRDHAEPLRLNVYLSYDEERAETNTVYRDKARAYQSALRELQEETHLTLLDDTMRHALKEVAVFDHPDRSQRGRTITHAHYFDLGERELPEVKAGDDAAQAKWVPIADLAAMEDRFMDDHFHMLDHFLGLTVTP